MKNVILGICIGAGFTLMCWSTSMGIIAQSGTCVYRGKVYNFVEYTPSDACKWFQSGIPDKSRDVQKKI